MLEVEVIQENLSLFYETINEYISEPRRSKLLKFYKSREELLALAPASSKKQYHGAYPGGYLNHVIKVLQAALYLDKVWSKMGADTKSYTQEELVFCALNHDLGKLGIEDNPRYIQNDSEWHIKNQGIVYKTNPDMPFLTLKDNTLFVLQSEGINLTINEYLSIKTHDGIYDETNKAYLLSYSNENKLKSCLPYIIQQADEIACRVEWELDQSTKEVVNFEKSNSSSNYKDEAKEKKLEYISKHGKK